MQCKTIKLFVMREAYDMHILKEPLIYPFVCSNHLSQRFSKKLLYLLGCLHEDNTIYKVKMAIVILYDVCKAFLIQQEGMYTCECILSAFKLMPKSSM